MLFSQFKKKPFTYDYFEFYPYKYQEEKEHYYGKFNEEELFGINNMGYESPSYKREARSLMLSVTLIAFLVATYGYSFVSQNKEMT